MDLYPKFKGKEIIIILLVVIIMPCSIIVGTRKILEYKLKGKDVTATIIDITRNGITAKAGKTITVTYTDQQGTLITAKAITNHFNDYVGEEIEAKVLPNDPYNVFVLPARWLFILPSILMVFLMLVALFCAWGRVRWIRICKLIREHGTVTDAKVIKVYHDEKDHYVDVEFYDTNIKLCKVYTEDYLATRQVGDTCTIKYYVKKPNKIYSAILV